MNDVKPVLEVKNLTKYFHGLAGSKICVLDDINFKINPSGDHGSVNSILSPTGAGKTVLLKILSAIEKSTSGEIFLDGENYLQPNGKIVFIPENPSSYPWMSVKENVEFGLKLKRHNPVDLKKKSEEIISLVGLDGYENHHPHEKSSGFRFRIALARSLAVEPRIILIDNSFKALNKETKKELYQLINNLKNQVNVVFVFATSNINEAILLSDNIFLMKKNPGKIFHQVDIREFDRNNLASEKNSVLKLEIENAFNHHEESLDLS